jgi:hypothetical protein
MRIHWKIGETGIFGAGGEEGTGLFVVVILVVKKGESFGNWCREREEKVGVN